MEKENNMILYCNKQKFIFGFIVKTLKIVILF
jgi:hypothetical protein